MGKKRTADAFLALAIIVLLGLAFRLYKIDVLPGYVSDEGRWALGPMQAIRYGDWFRGGWSFLYISPIWTSLLYLDFLLLGPGIEQGRYLTAVLGVYSAVMLYLICIRCGYGRRTATIAALFLALDGSFSVINRQVLSDSALTAAVCTTFFFYSGDQRSRKLSPLLLAVAICTKLTSVFAALVLFICGCIEGCKQKPRLRLLPLRAAIVPALGVALAGLVFLLLYFRDPSAFVEAWKVNLFADVPPLEKHSLIDAIRFYVLRMPLLLMLGLVGMILMFRNRSNANLLPLVWLVTGTVVIAAQRSQPARYYIPMVPALCAVAAYAVCEVRNALARRKCNSAIASGTAAAIVGVVLLYSLGTWYGYYFVRNHTNATGRDVTRWMNAHTTASTRVAAHSFYGIGLEADFYPAEYFLPDDSLAADKISKIDPDYVLFDDEDWRFYCQRANIDYKSQLREQFIFERRIGRVEIWRRKR